MHPHILSRLTSFLLVCVIFFPVPAHAMDAVEIDAALYEQAVSAYLHDNLTLDLQPFYDARPRTSTYANCAASYAALSGLSKLVGEQVYYALVAASDMLSALPGSEIGWKLSADFSYDWRTWACLYKKFCYSLGETVSSHLLVRVVENEKIEITVSLPEPDALFADAGTSAVFQYWVDYANLKTVYDEAASETPYTMPAVPEGYLDSLVFPLESVYYSRLKDTWYQSRSGGTRKHMGTDIKANRKASIYSCSDGLVAAVGRNTVGGYYVAVRDAYGYLYLYFHMFKNTQTVSVGESVVAGQLIGRVGNTGNSDTNHLHLGIISPDGVYLNPYIVLSQVILQGATADATETPHP